MLSSAQPSGTKPRAGQADNTSPKAAGRGFDAMEGRRDGSRRSTCVDDQPLPVTRIQAAFGVPVSEMRPIPGRYEPGAGQAATTETPPKFSAPVAAQVIDRPRLRARLTDGWEAGTTLLAATAGWGKTLLVSSWIAAGDAGPAVAWVTLDGGDDDERAFWRTLAAALLAVADEAASDDLRRLTPRGRRGSCRPGSPAACAGCGSGSCWYSTTCTRCDRRRSTPACCGWSNDRFRCCRWS